MLYIIGLGIHDEKDISLKGIEAAKKCESVLMELYTCPLKIDINRLEKLIGKKITVLERKDVEEKDAVLESAKKLGENTAFFAGGDALSATTHQEIALRAKKLGIEAKIIHASSIFSAVAETGLQPYKFGPAVSLPKPQKNYFPLSPYDKILENKKRGLHTLILLDIGMPASEALAVLLGLEAQKKKKLFNADTKLAAMARLGGDDAKIKYGKISELQRIDFGDSPHSLILPGDLHFLEEEFLEQSEA